MLLWESHDWQIPDLSKVKRLGAEYRHATGLPPPPRRLRREGALEPGRLHPLSKPPGLTQARKGLPGPSAEGRGGILSLGRALHLGLPVRAGHLRGPHLAGQEARRGTGQRVFHLPPDGEGHAGGRAAAHSQAQDTHPRGAPDEAALPRRALRDPAQERESPLRPDGQRTA